MQKSGYPRKVLELGAELGVGKIGEKVQLEKN